jgi:hypothetical protein
LHSGENVPTRKKTDVTGSRKELRVNYAYAVLVIQFDLEWIHGVAHIRTKFSKNDQELLEESARRAGG